MSDTQILPIITKKFQNINKISKDWFRFTTDVISLPLFGKVLASCEVAQMWAAEGWERKRKLKDSANTSLKIESWLHLRPRELLGNLE